MPHKGNGAMFIQYFILQGDIFITNREKLVRSMLLETEVYRENLKVLQVRLKVQDHRLLRP